MALIFRGSSLKKLVSVYASSHDSLVDMRTRPSTRSTEKQGAYRLRGGRGEESARAVCAAKERLHARRFFVRQIHEGPHWGSRQSTQYQSSPGTDLRPSHLTWHVFLQVAERRLLPAKSR